MTLFSNSPYAVRKMKRIEVERDADGKPDLAKTLSKHNVNYIFVKAGDSIHSLIPISDQARFDLLVGTEERVCFIEVK